MNTTKDFMKKALVIALSFLMVFSLIPTMTIESYAATAKKDGQTETYNSNQMYHIDILVEAEYEYTLTFSKDNGSADHADISISKTWNVASGTDVKVDSITANVYALVENERTSTDPVKTVTLSDANGWAVTVENMPLYDADNKKITYEVEEVIPDGYYGSVVTTVDSSVTENSSDKLVYTEDGKTITLYYDSTAPHININGTAYTSSTANWVNEGNGVYTLTFTYSRSGLTYYSIWEYDSAKGVYTYISDDYMKVTDIDYVTYTSTSGTEKILYDRDNYVTWTDEVTKHRTTKNGSLITVDRDYFNYEEDTDTNRADQEFWSTNRAIVDMPVGTTIKVGYDYTYGYYDKFGEWCEYSSTGTRVYDTSLESFKNVCGNASKGDTQRGYDVVIQLSEDDFYLGDGDKETYDVDITNTPVSSLTIEKEVTNPGEMPESNQKFTFKIVLDEFLGEKINGTFSGVTFVDGEATVTLQHGESIEIAGLPEGIEYAVSEINIPENYTVEQNDFNGTLAGQTVTFKNTYVDPVKYGNLEIRKDVTHPYGTGYEVPDKYFEMTVTLLDGNGEPVANAEYDVVKGDGTESKITTDKDGQFTISLKDGQTFLVKKLEEGIKATVVEKEYAGFTATYYPANGVTIVEDTTVEYVVTNAYIPEELEVSINISGNKSVTGTWSNEVFTFYLQKYVYDSASNTWGWVTIATDTATSSEAAPNVDFMSSDLLTFTTIGTYEYQVIEANHGKTIDGVTYDAVMHTFTVTVTDVDMDGKLEATIKSTHGGDTTDNSFQFVNGVWVNNNINFSNEINKGKTAVTVMIQKALVNASGSTRVDLSGYAFELYKTDSNYSLEGATLVQTSELTDLAGESYVHLEYGYEQEGTYYYVLKEKATGITGMKDSDAIYKIEVVVTAHNDGSVTRTVTVNGTKYDANSTSYPTATFTNTYNVNDANLTLPVTKKLVGKELTAGDYTFELYEITDFVDNAPVVGETPIKTLTNNANGKVEFGLTFSEVGTYYYKVVEKVPEGAVNNEYEGVTYDTSAYYVRVTVADGGEGSLVATYVILNASEMVFNNTYDADPVTVDFDAHKTLSGKTLEADMFSFTFAQVNESGHHIAGTEIKTVTNDADGNVDFGEITYEAAGTYYYQIKEVKGSLGGITYDESVYNYKVVVTDNGTGNLVAKVYESKDGSEYYVVNDVNATFANAYNASPVKLPIYGIKTLEGRDMDAGEFSFQLKDASGKVLQTVKNDADGEFQFEAIKYEQTGEYEYTVEEVIPEGAVDGVYKGVKYDNTVYKVKVVVTDNGQGRLVATPTIEGATHINFKNTYEVAPVEVKFNAQKTLNNKTLENEQFTFHLAQLIDGKHNLLDEAKNDADGTVTFDTVTLNKEGTYTYIVHEVNGGLTKDGITYDGTSYHYVVEVKDNGEGQLVAYLNGEVIDKTITSKFENTYDAKSASLVLNVEKLLKNSEGKVIDFGGRSFDFNLVLKSAPGGVVTNFTGDGDKVTITDNDIASFKTLVFHDQTDDIDIQSGETYFVGKGEYIFEIREVQTNEYKGVECDDTVYTVVITIGDNTKGELTEDVQIYKGTVEAGEKLTSATNPYNPELTPMVFTNVYTPAPTSVNIEAQKIVEGKSYVEGEFSFQLKDESGKVLQTVKNDEPVGDTAAISFEEIEYTKAGVYQYTIAEVKGGVANMIYDSHEYKVTVTVTDDGKGQLNAEVSYGTYNGTAPVFRNVYNAPTVIIEKAQAVGNGAATTEKLVVKADDIVTYTLTVKNISKGDASDLVVTDAIPAGLTLVEGSISDGGTATNGEITWNLAELEAGKDKVLSFQVKVPDVKEDTTWKNVAAVSYKDPGQPDNPPKEDKTEEVEIFEGVPEVSIEKLQSLNGQEKTKDKLTVEAGDNVKYVLIVKNTGTEAAENVVITDEVPEGLILVDAGNGTVDGRTITWNMGDLEVGEVKEVIFEVEVPVVDVNTTWRNVGTVDYTNDPEDPNGNEPPEESNEVVIETEVAPELSIKKAQAVNDGEATEEKQAVESGDKVTYYLTVNNSGDGKAVDVVITDTVPEGLTLVEGSISDGGIYENGVITWTIGEVAAGESVVVSFEVEIPVVDEDTVWENVGTVTYKDPDDPEEPKEKPSNEVEVETDVDPKLSIEKAQAVNDGEATEEKQAVEKGDKVTYYLTINNSGDGKVVDVVITDRVPAGLVLVEGSISDGGVYENGVITWTIEEMAAGESVVVSFTVEVPQVNEDTTWENVGTVTYTDPGEPDEPKEEPSNEVEIEEDVPELPETGDNSNTALWTAVMALAATGFFGLGFKRREEDE